MSEKKPLAQKEKSSFFSTIPRIIEMLKSSSRKEYNVVPIATILGIFALVGYVVLPADVIPDVLPFVGILDDASVLAIVLMLAQFDLNKYEEWKSQKEKFEEVTEEKEPET